MASDSGGWASVTDDIHAFRWTVTCGSMMPPKNGIKLDIPLKFAHAKYEIKNCNVK